MNKPLDNAQERIAIKAARCCKGEDYQVAQNLAYSEALKSGMSEEDAENTALREGSIHGQIEEDATEVA